MIKKEVKNGGKYDERRMEGRGAKGIYFYNNNNNNNNNNNINTNKSEKDIKLSRTFECENQRGKRYVYTYLKRPKNKNKILRPPVMKLDEEVIDVLYIYTRQCPQCKVQC